MALHALLAKAGSAVATGLVGAAAYDAARKALASAPLRDGAVLATAWGLKGTRRAEEVAENVRLQAADILAEAKEKIGEQSSPPGVATDVHDHDH
ncbi:hypothetical protein GOEFS_057_00050 [Gordonia effusa NBRC 100432]|uniref:DUF1490 family protein n=1 Tax=Gordonia effusa NBRC 100432 TaxID=1077974 RepID=H0R0C8_9ACTN|nr:DUF1490 family protein [Gordonia effusa]GAB18529.1 hypothetical protein GOEFS_057_00050 [Gordonia effusa NBRC 100432]